MFLSAFTRVEKSGFVFFKNVANHKWWVILTGKSAQKNRGLTATDHSLEIRNYKSQTMSNHNPLTKFLLSG